MKPLPAMPPLGYGSGTTWYGGKQGDEAMAAAVTAALTAGFRHIDAAEAYKTEAAVGLGLARYLAADGAVPRESLWVTSKISPGTAVSAEAVRARAVQALADLQLEYLDLFLIHAPFGLADLRMSWAAMESLVDDGLVRFIGVSNFRPEDLSELLSFCKIRPMANQIEHHPHLCVHYCFFCSHLQPRDRCLASVPSTL